MTLKNLIIIVTLLNVSIAQKDPAKREFFKWSRAYKKTYKDSLEREGAFINFKENYQEMQHQKLDFNNNKSLFQLRLNAFSAENTTQVTKRNGFDIKVSSIVGNKFGSFGNVNLANMLNNGNYPPAPNSLDYRQKSMVTNVSDQGFYCASCYAFSALCALEGQVAKQTGVLRGLSEQNVVDCSGNFGNSGCRGGFMGAAFDYIMSTKGVETDTAYPYAGVTNTCSYSPLLSAQKVSSYGYVVGDEENLKRALAYIGPLAVALRGDLRSFLNYGGGIYDDSACDSILNHAACLVGYGTDNTTSPPTNYWILKNSWGEDWGEKGYLRMVRGRNLCGVTSYVLHPNL